MLKFLSEYNKIIKTSLLIFILGYLLFFSGGLVQTIFDIGKQVGSALAQWI